MVITPLLLKNKYMKVGLNFTHYIKGRVGGHGNYIKSLAYYFPKVSPQDTFYIVCHPNETEELSQYDVEIIEIPKQKTPKQLTQLLYFIVKLYQFDVWYSPLLILDPIPCPSPAVFNIPDMQHEYFPHFFNEHDLAWRKRTFALSTQYTNAIITGSNDARNDITRLLDIHPKNVFAIPISASYVFDTKISNKKKTLQKYNLDTTKYLFYPANAWPHKNHKRLFKAFARIQKKYNDIFLVLTGFSYNSDDDTKELVQKLNLEKHIHYLGYIDDKDMPILYKNALGLVFPSLFEGFGIPLIEAMKSNCPIMCSDVTSIPEVAGDAALYFDPLSVKDISEKLDLFLSNEKLRKNLVKKGKKQAQKYSYKTTAEQTLHVLKTVARKKLYTLQQVSPDISKQKKQWPKISIITPSYNQGKYIERTIKSVLDQNYPNLEYIVMDGGSTDETVDILKKYDDKIIWTSEPDKGQTDAINKGIRRSTGDIIGYLNSDDTYEPEAFTTVANFFVSHPQAAFIHGKGKHIDENDTYIEDYPSKPTDYKGLHAQCHVCQPTTFWKRELMDNIGYFDDTLQYAMDVEYWTRASKKYKLHFLPVYIANTRLYEDTKTLGQKVPVHKEIIKVQQKHYKKVHQHWIFSLVHVEMERVNKKSFFGYTQFIFHIIIMSFYYFLRYNRQLPPKKAIYYYGVWLKHWLLFIMHKKYESII